MTKVQVTYKLSRALDNSDLQNISKVHAVYGILAATVKPSLEELFVEYDATRLSPKDVTATLERHGIPVTY
jgi:hypothetical protein